VEGQGGGGANGGLQEKLAGPAAIEKSWTQGGRGGAPRGGAAHVSPNLSLVIQDAA